MVASEADKRIGQNVGILRGEMSQQSLADAMRRKGHKWSQSTVWSVEQGDRPVRLAEAEDLAQIFNTSLGEFTVGPKQVGWNRVLGRLGQQLSVARDDLELAAVRYDEAQRSLKVNINAARKDDFSPTEDLDNLEYLTAGTAKDVVAGDLEDAYKRFDVERKAHDARGELSGAVHGE